MYEQIRYEVERSVATITMHRPERLNAWTAQMGRELKQAFASAERDPEVVAIILTGAGRGFCSGADLSVLGDIAGGQTNVDAGPEPDDTLPGDATMGPSFRGPFTYPMSVLKPVIGAINGAVAGLGLPMALSCDLRFASDQAFFSTAFARRGLVAEWGTSWLLPRLVGLGHTADLLLSARKVGAVEAERMGLVNRVVPHEELLTVARAYAEDIAENCSPSSMAVIKRDVLMHMSTSLVDAERDNFKHMQESFTRPDFAESLAAFSEKRPPKFTRRTGA
ncbi:MAG TPA: enoyl-CoA hydratase-related protein [Polyangiales bacterium]